MREDTDRTFDWTALPPRSPSCEAASARCSMEAQAPRPIPSWVPSDIGKILRSLDEPPRRVSGNELARLQSWVDSPVGIPSGRVGVAGLRDEDSAYNRGRREAKEVKSLVARFIGYNVRLRQTHQPSGNMVKAAVKLPESEAPPRAEGASTGGAERGKRRRRQRKRTKWRGAAPTDWAEVSCTCTANVQTGRGVLEFRRRDDMPNIRPRARLELTAKSAEFFGAMADAVRKDLRPVIYLSEYRDKYMTPKRTVRAEPSLESARTAIRRLAAELQKLGLPANGVVVRRPERNLRGERDELREQVELAVPVTLEGA